MRGRRHEFRSGARSTVWSRVLLVMVLLSPTVAGFAKRIRDLAMQGPKLAAGTHTFAHPRFPGVVHVTLNGTAARLDDKLVATARIDF